MQFANTGHVRRNTRSETPIQGLEDSESGSSYYSEEADHVEDFSAYGRHKKSEMARTNDSSPVSNPGRQTVQMSQIGLP